MDAVASEGIRFERESDGVKNYTLVRDIINKANEKMPGKVLLCINGHHHCDNIRIIDGVCYFDLNSVSFDWVPLKHNCYPEKLCAEYKLVSNTVVYNDPLFAVIDLDGNTITVEGTQSSMFMGINRENTENSLFDSMGRTVVPRVQSTKITL